MSVLAVTNFGLTLELDLREQSCAVSVTALLPSTQRATGREMVGFLIAPASTVDVDIDGDHTRNLWVGGMSFALEAANVDQVRAFEERCRVAVRVARKAAKQ